MSLNESQVEEAALGWFGELGWAMSSGMGRSSHLVLVGRLRGAIWRMNPAITKESDHHPKNQDA